MLAVRGASTLFAPYQKQNLQRGFHKFTFQSQEDSGDTLFRHRTFSTRHHFLFTLCLFPTFHHSFILGHYAYFGTSKQEEVAVKIVSPYLQRTGPNCKLRFQYRLHGMPKTELLVVLEHLPDPSNSATESPMQLRMIPTRNSINSK